MAGIFDTPLSRKRFMAASAAMAGAWATPLSYASGRTQEPARLALLSDTHIPAVAPNGYRGFVPADNLRLVVEQVVSSQAQAAILNGDAARLVGEREDYATLKELLQPVAEQIPIHIGLGNHDDRANFLREFPQDDQGALVRDKHVSMFDLSDTRFVVLDSLLYVNKVAGLLGQRQRDWLEGMLDEPDERPIVFFVHHTLGDGDGDLLDFDRVFRLMQPHRKVKAIFYGHSHRYQIEQRDYIYLINQPAIGYNFNDAQPVGWLDASFSPTGVDMTLHAVAGNRDNDGQTTSVEWD